ncbi:MAPEG family protein [uncultured Variovorax sp.]|uniref:MAPEG family protein n=1 Tax=uncultured Variovorax sp. TaxID=114708 RepID=UPI0025D22FCB|nr:MAPEG family protein [uncultured Variovorax sp.]
MNNPSILYPVFALAALTGVVLLLIPFTRVRAVLRREVRAADFRLGESAAVPDAVRIPNRNYMNLLELPVLFYVVCLLFYVAVQPTPAAVWLAWAYVGLRALHTAVHLTYNHVLHRLGVFAASNVVLVALWVLAAARLVR